ncbi:MAG: O-antigen ligase family protein [Planctomycetota bacterium]|nr:O-antigen ligase family protein [Planctomycetota bacterium]
MPGLLWALLWLAITSSPWTLTQIPSSALEQLHYYRALGPLVALGVGALILLGRAGGHAGVSPLPWVLRPWSGFAVLAILACAGSPNPEFALYWALSYAAAIVVLWSVVDAPTAGERLAKAKHLNYLSWAIAAALLLVLLYVSRGQLFVQTEGGLSGYGVANRVRSFGGVTMVRPSGLARSAVVPALFTFVLAWRSHGLRRLLWLAAAGGCSTLVVLMQSRGATLGLAAGMALALLLMGQRARYVGGLLLALALVVLFAGVDVGIDTESAVRHVNREGISGRTDVTSGRTRDWGIAWSKIMESPFWGWGPQADRFFFQFHVHNTYLYAWLAAGVMGVIGLAWGVVRMWRLFVRAVRNDAARDLHQHTLFVQIGCLVAFFTIRGVPEVSGAMFGIDLLLMLPAMAWLDCLEQARLEQAAVEEPEA